jgi:CheY-like chemotaxis protein
MPQQPSILLIEDEANLRHNLGVLLEGEGYRVASAGDGAEGIRKLREGPFDLVITDVVMPEVDGFEVMEYLKDYAPDTVVVAITAYVSAESAIEALRRGAYDYLAKPFDVDHMQIVVKRALEKAGTQIAFRDYIGELKCQADEHTGRIADANLTLEQSMKAPRAVQEQLAQAERLRALGAATVGVAPHLSESLATIVGFARRLAKIAPAESGMKPQLEQIGDMAFGCHEIVKNLAHLPSEPAPERVQIHLNAICEEMLAELASQADLSRIVVERRLDGSLPPIMGKPHQLLQAFTAIALHGCRTITSHGGEGRLTVETKWGDGVIQVVFHVDGLGLTGGYDGVLLNPVLPIRESTGGPGLNLAYELIKEQGGRIAVHSILGEGASFVVELPSRASWPSTFLPPSGESESVEHRRVLVVDADEGNLALLREVVYHLGHDADGSLSAQQALEKLANRDYDLIITDTHLSGMDGLYFYQRLHELRPELARRVIFIAGRVLSDDAGAFIEEMGCPLIQKPFSVIDIEMSMRRALEV